MTMRTSALWKRAALKLAALFTGALMLLVASTASARNENPGVLPPNSNPHGSSYEEWAADWADWFLSIPLSENPFNDPDGRFCLVGQSGHVFLLGNNFGGVTVRSCNVPSGQMIFFGAAGTIGLLHFDADTEDGLRNIVDDALSLIANLSVDIDGKPVNDLQNYRFVSPLFDFTLPPDNLAGLPPGPYQGVNGGYFLMLSPLSSGEHVVHFHSETPGFLSDVTYLLFVGSH